jgi:hypothetical protein
LDVHGFGIVPRRLIWRAVDVGGRCWTLRTTIQGNKWSTLDVGVIGARPRRGLGGLQIIRGGQLFDGAR